MATTNAIYMSTAGMKFCYGVETTAGTTPTTFTEIEGATSLSEVSSEKEQIEVTPLSATVYKEYVGGLADAGGSFEVGFNESNKLHTTWASIVSAYASAKSAGLNMWFECYHPDLDEGFFFIGEPSILGFGGADVSSAYSNSGKITINSIKGWATKVAPTV